MTTQTADQVADAEQKRRWRPRLEAAERLEHAYAELQERIADALQAARDANLDHVVERFDAYDPFRASMLCGPHQLVVELQEALTSEISESEPCRDCPHDFGRHRGQPEPDLCSPGCEYWTEDGRGHSPSCAAADRDESSCDKCACQAFSSWGVVR